MDSAEDGTPALKRTRGRKRLHDAGVEQRMLLEAAMVVMRRNGFAEAKVTDILEEAGLSSRSFYRHFASKDELVIAMCRRDVAGAERRLRARVDEAPDPIAALHAYIDEWVAMYFDSEKGERVAVLTSEGAQRAAGYAAYYRLGLQALIEPLVEVLRLGNEANLFDSPAPERDATTIYYLLHSTSPQAPRNIGVVSREEAKAHVLRFCAGAIGLVEGKPRRRRAGRAREV